MHFVPMLYRTMIGRGRAWLRFVLMQKKLADNFRLMIESRAKLRSAGIHLVSHVMYMSSHGMSISCDVRIMSCDVVNGMSNRASCYVKRVWSLVVC